MYTQYFFKFPSKDEMHTALEAVEWYGKVGVADGEDVHGFTLSPHDGSLDEVGMVIDQPAVYDQVTMEEIEPAIYVDAWHLNAVLKIDVPESLKQYLVTPSSPSRVFFGF